MNGDSLGLMVHYLLERLRFMFTAKLKWRNSSWEILRIENKQIKTARNDSYGYNWRETTFFGVEAINREWKIRGKLGHMVQIHVCRLA